MKKISASFLLSFAILVSCLAQQQTTITNSNENNWYNSVSKVQYISEFNINNRQSGYTGAYNKDPESGKNADTTPVIGKPGIRTRLEPIPIPGKVVPKSYDFSNVRICIDQINNNVLPPRPPVTNVPSIPKINSNGELEKVSTVTQPLAGLTDNMWSPGDVISVGFYSNETSALVINKVKQYAKTWETYANIKFDFINDVSKAEVKVGFAKDGTSWSWLGRAVLGNPFGLKTVNFGWLTDVTDETEFSRVIVHEFGHVLGFIHEHQSPASAIPWDKEKVYAFLGAPPNNWSRTEIDQQVFFKYSQSSTNFSAYDKHSIMHYFFPSELTTDGSSLPGNITLSVIDKQFSNQVYPFPPTPANPTGILHTGDDCDEIVFSVEYNVVDKNGIQFILEPGTDQNNNHVTWWKKIGVPIIAGSEIVLEMQDGSSTTKTIPVSLIDKTRSISFGKAKFAGVHTTLNFKWPALPAIIGGCRVRLTWRRDKC